MRSEQRSRQTTALKWHLHSSLGFAATQASAGTGGIDPLDRQECAAGSVPGDPAAAGADPCDDLGQARLFEQAMRHAAIGMALVTAEGRFLEVNGALCRMLGRDEATLRQLRLRDVTHPDDLAESLQLVEELVAGRREAFQLEKRYIHSDGHLIWGQASVSCLRSDGQCLFIVQIVDISEARRQRLELAEQDAQYRQLAENAADVVCRLDAEGRITWLSPSVESCLGWQPEQLLNRGLAAITHPDARRKLQQLHGQEHDRTASEPVVVDLQLRCADGSWRWMSVKARPAWNSAGGWIGWISGWRDIQAEVEIRQQLDQALHTDPLTGLASRSTMLERIAAALARRDQPAITAVLSVGIDRLSQVNNALTHRAGDLLIATVASRLVEAIDQPEQVARGTGDTFIVLLDRLKSPEQAAAMAERLRLASKGPISYEGQTIEPSASIGLALAQAAHPAEQANRPTADELLRDAALAMRQAADRGRDRCAFADPGLAVQAQQGLQQQHELRTAIQTAEIQAWFMPLVDLTSGALQGYEALVRWPRRDGRVEMPDTFLPVARSAQMAEAIDRLVLQQSIAALAELPAPLSVAANLSGDTLAMPGLAEQVQQWLLETGVAAQRLHLEITETTLLHLSPEVLAAIQQLAALGVRWVMDDFGTGFSSISHLRDLPIHGLKLDRSFTEGLRQGDHKSVRLAQALTGLAEGLGLETIAEGIESADEAVSLRDLGWRCGQGWFFGKAAPLSHWQTTAIPTQRPSPIQTATPLAASRRSWALAVTDSVPVGLFALRLAPGRQPQLLFASRRWLEMFQLEREQVLEDLGPILARIHPQDRHDLMKRWQQHVVLDAPLAWEGRLVIRDVTTWVLLEATPLAQADGSCIWQGVLSDITRRKQQELHLRRILDEAPIAMAINDLRGNDPQITYVNEQFIQCFGYDLNTIPRISAWARLAYPDPQQRTAVFQLWDASVAQARSSDGVVAPLEAEITTADGRLRQVLISAVLLGDGEMVVSFMDITAWRQAERELQQARSVLAENALAITEAIPVGTYTMVLPPQGGMASFSFMSERFLQICGLNREEAAADPFQAFACVHPDDYDAWVQANAEAFANKKPFYGECRVVVDGELRWISAESIPRDLPDGSTVWEGVLIDISDRQQALAQLAASEEHFRLLAENAHDVIWTMEADGRISYVSPSIQLLRGFSPEETMAQPVEQIHPPESQCRFQAYVEQLLADLQASRSPQPFRGELEYCCRDGSTIWAEVIALPTFDEQGAFKKLLGVSRDISERKRYEQQQMAANQKLEDLATTDSLTGIWNRRHLETTIQQAMDRSDRYGEPLSLILCDIDHFKAINDDFGHPVGDRVLIEFCRRIREHLRSSDGFGRWGGEEFLILLSHTDAPAARALAKTLRQLIVGSHFPEVGMVTASFGVAQRRDQEPFADWVQRVDRHLYAAKQSGRNHVTGD